MRWRSVCGWMSVMGASLALAQDAPATDASIAAHTPSLSIAETLALDPSATTSVGAANEGRLERGVALPEQGPGFVHNPRRPPAARYGTVEMVQALIRAAAAVHEGMPGSTLVINDLGYAEGGPIVQHGSHQAGRDVDVLFYALDRHGEPMPAVGVPLEPNGRGWDYKDLADPSDDVRVSIDLPRTWRFVQALLAQDGDHVQRIFIVEHLRTLLLKQAEKVRAPKRVVQRFEEVTCQPATAHDDHMHIRFFCSADDVLSGCYDTYPMYPWRNQWLRKNGARPAMVGAWPEYQQRLRARREGADERTTDNAESHAQNEREGAGWHQRVKDFLERRKAWEVQPHPGRTYCR